MAVDERAIAELFVILPQCLGQVFYAFDLLDLDRITNLPEELVFKILIHVIWSQFDQTVVRNSNKCWIMLSRDLLSAQFAQLQKLAKIFILFLHF